MRNSSHEFTFSFSDEQQQFIEVVLYWPFRRVENTRVACCVEFCVQLDKSATETFEIIRKSFKNEAVSRYKTFEWRKRAVKRLAMTPVLIDRRSNLKNVEMVVKIREIIRSYRRMTIRELFNQCNVSYVSCQTILTENVCVRRVYANMVILLLSRD